MPSEDAMFLTDNDEYTKAYWEDILASEGMPAELLPIDGPRLSVCTEHQHDLCKDYITED